MSRPKINRRHFLALAGAAGVAGAAAAPGAAVAAPGAEKGHGAGLDHGHDWTNYQVYRPSVENHVIYRGAPTEADTTLDPLDPSLKYNHVPTLAYFKGTWIALWNANTLPLESQKNQFIFMSTSKDAKNWTTAELAFTSGDVGQDLHNRSTNPIVSTLVQWQPGLIVVGEELWCFWSQLPAGLMDDPTYGAYWSVLTDPDGDWTNKRILFDGNPDYAIDGIDYRVLPSQNPILASTGRLMVPINLVTYEGGLKRRDSVMYTDDLGASWQASPGTNVPERPAECWEPSLWEQPDGTIGMFARNGLSQNLPDVSWSEKLVYAESQDYGETWSALAPVPVETIISRMYVTRVRPGTDRPAPNSMFVLTHNDSHANYPLEFSNYPPGAELIDRENLALYFKRGNGNDFVAGPTYTAGEALLSYPQMVVKDGELYVAYTEGIGISNIRIARISSLPDEQNHYIFPRDRVFADTVTPRRIGDTYQFYLYQHANTTRPVATGNASFSGGVWVASNQRGSTPGNLIDTHTPDRARGFSFKLHGGRVYFQIAGMSQAVNPNTDWRPHVNWSYLGFSYDADTRQVTFYENGVPIPTREGSTATVQITDDLIGSGGLDSDGGPANIGGPVPDATGFFGLLRYAAVYPGVLTDAQHATLYNRFAHELGAPSKSLPVEPVPGMSLAVFDPAAADFRRQVRIPVDHPGGIIDVAGDTLRFNGEISAGIDLDDSTTWSTVTMMFEFRPERGDTFVLATLGDIAAPTRLTVRGGMVRLEGRATRRLGRVNRGRNKVVLTMNPTTITAEVNGTAGTVDNAAQWRTIYLGQGVRDLADPFPQESSFLVDRTTVRTMTTR